MKLNKVFIWASCALLLMGCGERKVLKVEKVKVEVLDVVFIKRAFKDSGVYGNLKVIETGELFYDVNLRCRDPEYKKIPIGSVWDVYKQYWTFNGNNGISLLGTDIICKAQI